LSVFDELLAVSRDLIGRTQIFDSVLCALFVIVLILIVWHWICPVFALMYRNLLNTDIWRA